MIVPHGTIKYLFGPNFFTPFSNASKHVASYEDLEKDCEKSWNHYSLTKSS